MSILPRLGYTAAEQTAIETEWAGSMTAGLRVNLLDRSGNFVRDITAYVKGGQVDVDGAGRRCQLALFDPANEVQLLSGAAFLQRQIAVWATGYVIALGEHVEIPVYHGPIVKCDVSGSYTSLNCADKRLLAQGDLIEPHVFAKGTKVTDAIRFCLHDLSGIPLGDITLPDLADTLPGPLHVTGKPWTAVERLAQSVGMGIQWDGAGKTLMRELPTAETYTFYGKNDQGNPATVCTDPERSLTLTDGTGAYLPNAVRVEGFKGGHGKPLDNSGAPGSGWSGVHVIRYADPQSPISRESLAENGVLYNVLRTIENPHIKDPVRARAVADAALLRSEQASQSVTFDALPLPWFDRGDFVTVQTGGFVASFNLDSFSLPLGPNDSGTMTVGYQRALSFAGAKVKPV